MRRKGLLPFVSLGVILVLVFLVVAFVYITFIQDLNRVTEIKSQAAYERLGLSEEILGARCIAESRGIFRVEDVSNGNLGCIRSGRSVALSFEMENGDVYKYRITDGVDALSDEKNISEFPGGEQVREVVYAGENGKMAGTVTMVISYAGIECRSYDGACLEEGETCFGDSRSDLSCARGKTCCIRQGGALESD